jgi:uncharacterized protein (TIGR00296 family)
VSADPLVAAEPRSPYRPLGRGEGEAAVRLARATLERGFLGGAPRDPARLVADLVLPPRFEEAHGVFVSVRTYPEAELRGCVGYPMPVYPLSLAVPRLAWAAGTEDPRFVPITGAELSRVALEVSVLGPLERIEADDPDALAAAVQIGLDGLVVRIGEESGLLLPQVAVEQGWDAARFLSEACVKAGFPEDAWRWPGARVYRFRSMIWREKSPGGEIVEAERDSPAKPAAERP